MVICVHPQTIRERERERERDRSATNIHELATRTVTMSRDQQDTHGFGICVKGGKDAGLGVYISRIEEGSLAERSGLRPGDTILEVNGTPFTTVSHDEALKVFFESFQFSVLSYRFLVSLFIPCNSTTRPRATCILLWFGVVVQSIYRILLLDSCVCVRCSTTSSHTKVDTIISESVVEL